MTPEQVYDKLYRIAGHILRENDPCQIRKDAEGRVSCAGSRSPYSTLSEALCCGSYYPNDPPSSRRVHCCRNWQPNKGCTTQNLACKMFLCGSVLDKHRNTFDALYALRRAAMEAFKVPINGGGLVEFFKSKEELFASRP